jgi:hypothetical protein
MTLHSLEWYRVKETKQYCHVASIISSTDPQINLTSASENTKGFHIALVWFTLTDETADAWTKRAILMEAKKAFGLLREPTEDDLPIIEKLRQIGSDIPFHSMSVDGTKTITTDI